MVSIWYNSFAGFSPDGGAVHAEYDLGERFDLKAKYCDNGWVDEDAAFGKQVARFFGMGKKKKTEDDSEQGSRDKGRKK